MLDNFRQFDVTDPFGRLWHVEFRWSQNAISIRHADAIDCKYYLSGGEEARECVVALPHADLAALATRRKRDLTDPWVMKLASLHVARTIANWEDMEKTIVTPSAADLESYNLQLEQAAAEQAERTAMYR